MSWGYLDEFWDAITEVGTYSVAWFESIGNAVAGAIGGFFSDLIHHVYDSFYFFEWLLDNLGDIMITAFSPLNWLFSFFSGFLKTATSSLEDLGIEVNEITVYTDNVEALFEAVPYSEIMLNGIAGALGVFFLIVIIKQFTKI